MSQNGGSSDNINIRNGSTGTPNIAGLKHGGTITSPTATLAGSLLLRLTAGGYGTFLAPDKAGIDFTSSQAWTGLANGTQITFSTTANGTTSTPERMRIDNGGNVGIGTSTPNTALEVSNSGTPFIRISDISGGNDVGLELFRTGAGFNDWRISNSGGDIDFRFSTDDLATTALEYQMTSAGFLPGVTNANSLGNSLFRWTAVHATNGIIQTSDRREKENIKSLNYGLKDILRLSPVKYIWKTGEDKSQKVGLIAQEVATVIPEVVSGLKADGSVGEQRLGMNYAELVPVLINAIKEQQQIIDQLNQNVNSISAELASLKKQFNANTDKEKTVSASSK